jgi:hypothetical protein
VSKGNLGILPHPTSRLHSEPDMPLHYGYRTQGTFDAAQFSSHKEILLPVFENYSLFLCPSLIGIYEMIWFSKMLRGSLSLTPKSCQDSYSSNLDSFEGVI